MEMHLAVKIFIIIWCVPIVISIVYLLFRSIFRGDFTTLPITLLPIGMFLFMVLVSTGGLKYESNRSKDFFKKLFEAEMIG